MKTPGSDDIGWVLWSATIGMDTPISARIESAKAGGFTRISIGPSDVVKAGDQGTNADELGRAIRDAGLEVVIDPVMNWYGGAPLPGPYAAVDVDDVFRMCEVLPVVSMTAIGPFSPDEVPVAGLAERFGAFCDRAADAGVRVHLEFMPFTVITDLAMAWGIVQGADARTGGLLFDTWHFFRSTPDLAMLAGLPGERIFAVQVSDGAAELHGTLEEDTFHRLMPGEGTFDLVGVLRVLDRIGGLQWIGPEVLSPVTAAMNPLERARIAGDRLRELIVRARSEQP